MNGLMFNRKTIFVFVLFCMILLSCSMGKQRPLDQLEALTEDLRVHHEAYSVADWKQAYSRYEQIAADMENYTYTTEEAEMIGQLEGECVGFFMKSAVMSLDGWESEIKGFLRGLEDVVK